MQPCVESLRTRDARRNATHSDHRSARGAPARGAPRRRRAHVAPRSVREPEGEGARAQGVQRGREEERLQGHRDASGRRAHSRRVDARERAGHCGAEDPAEEDRAEVRC